MSAEYDVVHLPTLLTGDPITRTRCGVTWAAPALIAPAWGAWMGARSDGHECEDCDAAMRIDWRGRAYADLHRLYRWPVRL